MRASVVPAWICLLAAAVAPARDRSDGLALPAAAQDPPGSVAALHHVAVSLAGETIVVTSQLTAGPDPAGLVVTIPAFAPVEADEPYPTRQFPELELRLDGGAANPADTVDAVAGNRHIIGLLELAHLDPWAITHNPALADAAQANAGALVALSRAGAIQKTADGYVARWAAGRCLRVALKPGLDQALELRHAARPAFAPETLETLVAGDREQEVCLTERVVRRLLRGGRAAPLIGYQYTIATGIDGLVAADVRFAWTPDAATAHDAIFVCGAHRRPIAVTGTLRSLPVQVDPHGVLRILRVAVPSADRR